jgi:hypothetical protein
MHFLIICVLEPDGDVKDTVTRIVAVGISAAFQSNRLPFSSNYFHLPLLKSTTICSKYCAQGGFFIVKMAVGWFTNY